MSELYKKIERFIKLKRYVCSTEDVLEGYERNKEGYRISYEVGQCIINFENEIKQLKG